MLFLPTKQLRNAETLALQNVKPQVVQRRYPQQHHSLPILDAKVLVIGECAATQGFGISGTEIAYGVANAKPQTTQNTM